MNWSRVIKSWLGLDPNFKPRLCYSQDGEDLILDRLLDGQKEGFYIDIGAHHPLRFSNTYLFYLRGWMGINIDAEPGSMNLFQKLRPRDISIECGVAVRPGFQTYFRFNEPALNTFDPAEAQLKNSPPYYLIQRVDTKVRRLDDLLRQHLPAGQVIDFLTIDVEGSDLQVLESNDWALFRPRFILVETLRVDMLNMDNCPIVKFLRALGYVPVAKAYNTSFFVSEVNE